MRCRRREVLTSWLVVITTIGAVRVPAQGINTAAARAEFQRFLALAPSRYDREITDARQRLARSP